MAHEYKMPKFGLTMEEGTITKWFKKVGDKVDKGEELLEIETDKITNVELAPESGVILHIAYEEGKTAPCTALLAVIGQEGESFEDVTKIAPSTELTKSEVVQKSESVETAEVKSVIDSKDGVYASPAAKKLAKEKGIDVATLVGSGPNGRVIERDVLNAKVSPLALRIAMEHGMTATDIESIGSGKRIMSSDVKVAVAKNLPASTSGEGTKISGMRKVIAERMSQSWQVYPMVTIDMEADMSRAQEVKLRVAESGTKLSYTEIIVKVCATALSEFKRVNSSLIDGVLYEHDTVNVGVAVSLDNGLVVPVVKNAQNKSISTIGVEVKNLSTLARNGGLTSDNMTGGTFTVSNLGGYPTTHFTPIINYPEAAILGVCAIKEKVVVMNGEMVIRPILNLCLTFDHRIIDGALAAQFMTRVITLIENPFLLF